MKSIKEAKSRMKIGQRLLCVENTYRPALNGTCRTVTKMGAAVWKWKGDGDSSESSSIWPAGIEIIDADTIRIPLFGLMDKKPIDGHWLTLRFLPTAESELSEPAPRQPKQERPTEFTFTESSPAFSKAQHISRHAHKDAAVWKDSEGWHAAPVSVDILERAIQAVGEEGKFTVFNSGQGMIVRPGLARVFISNLQSGHYAHS